MLVVDTAGRCALGIDPLGLRVFSGTAQGRTHTAHADRRALCGVARIKSRAPPPAGLVIRSQNAPSGAASASASSAGADAAPRGRTRHAGPAD